MTPPAAELVLVAHDLARAATRLAEAAEEWLEASAAERPALRAELHRWQTILTLGAQRLAQTRTHVAEPPAPPRRRGRPRQRAAGA